MKIFYPRKCPKITAFTFKTFTYSEACFYHIPQFFWMRQIHVQVSVLDTPVVSHTTTNGILYYTGVPVCNTVFVWEPWEDEKGVNAIWGGRMPDSCAHVRGLGIHLSRSGENLSEKQHEITQHGMKRVGEVSQIACKQPNGKVWKTGKPPERLNHPHLQAFDRSVYNGALSGLEANSRRWTHLRDG